MNFSKQVLKFKKDIVRATQEFIQIPSFHSSPQENMPFGKSVNDGLEYILKLAESMGFTTKNLDGYCGYAEYGQGDIYIGVFGHVDVALEEPELWKHHPYGGEIENNRIYGSGAIDKGALIAALFAMKAIVESGKVLNRKVRIIIGTDERKYYSDIEHYLKMEVPPIAGISLDGYFPVTYAELAFGMFKHEIEIRQDSHAYIEFMKGGKEENLVPDYCCVKIRTEEKAKFLSDIRIYAKENGAEINAKTLEDGLMVETFGMERHSASVEPGINAVIAMLELLQFLKIGGAHMQRILSFLCMVFGKDFYGEKLGIACQDSFSGNLTLNLGAARFEEGKLQIVYDCRLPVTCNFQKAIEIINGAMDEQGFSCNECIYWPPTYFPQNHFLIKALLESYSETEGDYDEPFSSRTISYAKVIPNVVAFGARFPGEGINWERKEEYIDLDYLEKTAKIYANAIYKLCTEI